MKILISKCLPARRGNMIVLIAVGLVAILGLVAISVDGGAMLSERRQAQAVADAAALAAASDLYDNYWINSGDDPNGTAAASAFKVAADNGYTNDKVTSKVEVFLPPKTGPYTGKRGYVEVVVEYYYPRAFSTIFSTEPVTIRARAVALGMPVAADVGILVLDPHKKGAFNAQGGGGAIVEGTPIVVNSDSAEAAIAGGGGAVKAPTFWVTGETDTTGNGSFDGKIYEHRPGLADPLAYLPPPDPKTMTIQSHKKTQYTKGEKTLKPGVYKGGINVSGTGNLTLEPGIYYMDNGGFSFSGQGNLLGEGVLIYTNPGNGNSDTISVTGQGSMILSGMTSGPYAGITFWQRRDSTVTGTVTGTGGKTSITGTFYFAGALLNVNGNGGVANIGSQYISNMLELGGTGAIAIDWNPEDVAKKRSIHLVE